MNFLYIDQHAGFATSARYGWIFHFFVEESEGSAMGRTC